jgi:hypothetical protein
MAYILIQVNEATSFSSWWNDWKQGISWIFITTSSIFHFHGGLIHLKINPRDNTKCSKFTRKIMNSNFEGEKNSQLWSIVS